MTCKLRGGLLSDYLTNNNIFYKIDLLSYFELFLFYLHVHLHFHSWLACNFFKEQILNVTMLIGTLLMGKKTHYRLKSRWISSPSTPQKLKHFCTLGTVWNYMGTLRLFSSDISTFGIVIIDIYRISLLMPDVSCLFY